MSDYDYVEIVFDGPPGPVCGRFVECEDSDGKGIRLGEWVKREDGYDCLRIIDPRPMAKRIAELEAEVVKKDSHIKELNARRADLEGRWNLRPLIPPETAKDATIERLKELLKKSLNNAYDAEIEAALKEEKR